MPAPLDGAADLGNQATLALGPTPPRRGRHAAKELQDREQDRDDDPLQYADEDDTERAHDGKNELAPAHREEAPQLIKIEES